MKRILLIVLLVFAVILILFKVYSVYDYNYSPKARLRNTHVNNAQRVLPNMSSKEVESIMGNPDSIDSVKLEDYVYIYRYDLHDESEPYVNVYMDSTMHVRKIHIPKFEADK